MDEPLKATAGQGSTTQPPSTQAEKGAAEQGEVSAHTSEARRHGQEYSSRSLRQTQGRASRTSGKPTTTMASANASPTHATEGTHREMTQAVRQTHHTNCCRVHASAGEAGSGASQQQSARPRRRSPTVPQKAQTHPREDRRTRSAQGTLHARHAT